MKKRSGKDYITPVGSTEQQGEDRLLILAEDALSFLAATRSLGVEIGNF